MKKGVKAINMSLLVIVAAFGFIAGQYIKAKAVDKEFICQERSFESNLDKKIQYEGYKINLIGHSVLGLIFDTDAWQAALTYDLPNDPSASSFRMTVMRPSQDEKLAAQFVYRGYVPDRTNEQCLIPADLNGLVPALSQTSIIHRIPNESYITVKENCKKIIHDQNLTFLGTMTIFKDGIIVEHDYFVSPDLKRVVIPELNAEIDLPVKLFLNLEKGCRGLRCSRQKHN